MPETKGTQLHHRDPTTKRDRDRGKEAETRRQKQRDRDGESDVEAGMGRDSLYGEEEGLDTVPYIHEYYEGSWC